MLLLLYTRSWHGQGQLYRNIVVFLNSHCCFEMLELYRIEAHYKEKTI